jgi:uncharacterized protein
MDLYIEKIIEKMKEELSCSAHSIDHVMRVYNLCNLISKYEENVNMDILKPAALLHDIARSIESNDVSGEIDHAVLGSEMASDFLKEIGYPQELIEDIKHCIIVHRFRSGNEPKTIEAKILFDADKLDAIGSVGIARSFMLAGQFGQSIISQSSDEYVNSNIVENGRIKDVSKHSPFMEYEFKFKKIPSKLFTQKAIEIGNKRLEYMENYFTRLSKEIDGEL